MFYIYTVASDKEKAKHLMNTANQCNCPIQIVGITNWTGFIDKILTMKRIVDGHDDLDIVCFLDAYDVIAMANPEEVVEKFKTYDKDILMSSELNCYPEENRERYELVDYRCFESEYPVGIWNTPNSKRIRSNYKYMNSGGYIGYCRALKQMFNWKSEDTIRNIIELGGDQNFFTQYYLEFANSANVNVGIDWKQSIFQSLYKVDLKDFGFFNGRLYNHCLQTYPCFAHFNGFRDYGGCLVNAITGERKDAMEVFVCKLNTSRYEGNSRMEWRLPEFWYGGRLVGTIPQM